MHIQISTKGYEKTIILIPLREGYHPKERHAIALLFAEPEPRTEHRVEAVWAAASAGEKTVARVPRLRQQQ